MAYTPYLGEPHVSCVDAQPRFIGLARAPVTVEVHWANGLSSFSRVGLADTEVKEARERVLHPFVHFHVLDAFERKMISLYHYETNPANHP